MTLGDRPTFEEVARRMERNLVVVIAAALAIGLVLAVAGSTDTGQKLMSAGLVLLVLAPIIGLFMTLAGQVLRRAWPFAAAAAVTLAMLWAAHFIL